jgi:hypothetical protein
LDTIHFLGQVFPGAVKISLKDMPLIEWKEPPNVAESYQIAVVDSKIDVTCVTNRYSEEKLFDQYMRAYDLVRAAVDIFAFTHGYGLMVVLNEQIKPDGTKADLFFEDKALPPLATAFNLDPKNTDSSSYGVMFNMIISEPASFMALNDLIMAITVPHFAPVNCARAIEGVRHLIAPGVDRKQGWKVMRQNLNVQQSYLTQVTDTSTAPRHGDRTYIPGSVVQPIIKRSWIIMNRFLEFRKRGNQPLPIVDFPLLS